MATKLPRDLVRPVTKLLLNTIGKEAVKQLQRMRDCLPEGELDGRKSECESE